MIYIMYSNMTCGHHLSHPEGTEQESESASLL